MKQHGILLLNLGTPDSYQVPDVRKYLAQFLMDPFVIDIPKPLRWLLVHGIILRTRPSKSAEAYKSVWTSKGSPLRVESEAFRSALQLQLDQNHETLKKSFQVSYQVSLGMRYGSPSIASALKELDGCDKITVWPLYPQYAESSTRTALEELKKVAGERFSEFEIVNHFYQTKEFKQSLAQITFQTLDSFQPDTFLISFHGLPKRHIQKLKECQSHCFQSDNCCEHWGPWSETCYRQQCLKTAASLIKDMKENFSSSPNDLATTINPPDWLQKLNWTVSFQSRLGPGWVQPFTDLEIERLAKSGVKKLAVACPAFVADCLETLEEIGDRGRHIFLENGGQDFKLVPCLNANPIWIRNAASFIQNYSQVRF